MKVVNDLIGETAEQETRGCEKTGRFDITVCSFSVYEALLTCFSTDRFDITVCSFSVSALAALIKLYVALVFLH